MRALVTGCAGFIGSNLTDALLRDGAEVRGVDCLAGNHSPERKLENLESAMRSDRFSFVEADLADIELDELVGDRDVVFHLAGEPGVRSSWGDRFEAFLRNNVLATQRLLEAARGAPEMRFVHASSSSVYGQAERFPTDESVPPRPFSPYGTTKLAAEHLCRLYQENHGVQAVSLRYFSVFGPRQRPDMAFSRFFDAALAGEPITVFGDGEQTRDFTFVGDVVAGTIAASTAPCAPGGVYNIGGGAQVALLDAIEVIEGLVGTPLDIRHLEAWRGDVRDTLADTRKARADLGFVASAGLADGLAAQFTALGQAVPATP